MVEAQLQKLKAWTPDICTKTDGCFKHVSHRQPCEVNHESKAACVEARATCYAAKGIVLEIRWKDRTWKLPDRFIGEGNEVAEGVLRGIICRDLKILRSDLEIQESRRIIDALFAH